MSESFIFFYGENEGINEERERRKDGRSIYFFQNVSTILIYFTTEVQYEYLFSAKNKTNYLKCVINLPLYILYIYINKYIIYINMYIICIIQLIPIVRRQFS